MRTQKSASKVAGKAAKNAAPAKGSKLASLKNALLGLGGKKDAKAPAGKAAKAAAPAPKGKADKNAVPASVKTSKAAAQAQGAPVATASGKGAKGAKAAAPAPAPAKGAKGSAAKAATQALNQIASARSGKAQTRASAADSEVCREVACEGLATSGGYCRLHYIKNWKKIQRKALILKEGKLNQYIEELVAKYPDKYIDAIRQDLANDKDFAKVIYDLDLDESVDEFSDVEGENAESLIDNIKREFDDEGEAF